MTHTEAIQKLKSIQDDIDAANKRMALIKKCQEGKFYGSNKIEFKFTEPGKSNELSISIGYLNTSEWVKFHLQQEEILLIGTLHKYKHQQERIITFLYKTTTLKPQTDAK